MTYDLIDSPVGPVLVAGDARGLAEIRFLNGEGAAPVDPSWVRDAAAVRSGVDQLRAYFAGALEVFAVDRAAPGTAFQRDVWDAVAAVPFGRTLSYADVAARVGRPTAFRAVGAANGQNPLPIVVPCHRIVGRDGALTGFRGGLGIKRWLLAHEGATWFA